MANTQGVNNFMKVISKGIDRLIHMARNRKKGGGRIGRFFGKIGHEARR